MAQQHLDKTDIGAIFQHVSRHRVPEQVTAAHHIDTRFFKVTLNQWPKRSPLNGSP